MNDSILETVRHMVGGGEEHEHFDTDLIIYANSAIASLRRLGIGPLEGFSITGTDESWSDLLGDEKPELREQAKSYVVLKTKQLFDPPTTGATKEALQDSLKELEYDLNGTYEVDL